MLKAFKEFTVYNMDFLAFPIMVQVNPQSLHLQHSCLPSYVLYNMDIIYMLYSALTAPHGERSSPVEKVALFTF